MIRCVTERTYLAIVLTVLTTSSAESIPEIPTRKTPDFHGLSYLFAPEAKDLLKDPLQTSDINQGPTKSSRDYQSDSADLNSFPRFSIPLESLQLDSAAQSNDYNMGTITKYNTETSEIVEPTFIVPKGVEFPKQLIPQPSSPIVTYGVSINDGVFSRKEIRKDNGEFFSSYRDDDVTSAKVGSLVPTADGDQVLVLKGSYSFTSPEGLRFRVDYTADETGYHATQVPLVPQTKTQPV